MAAGASAPGGANILPGGNNAPPLLQGEIERASHGETLYLQIGLGMGRNLASTGIYVPNSFKPDSGLTVVLTCTATKVCIRVMPRLSKDIGTARGSRFSPYAKKSGPAGKT